VFIPYLTALELSLIVFLIDLSENILEASIVALENGVLGAQIQRIVPVDSILEAGMGEGYNGFIGVVHSHENSTVLEVEDVEGLGLAAISRSELNLELSSAINNIVCSTILVTESMTANNNGLRPCWNKARNILNDNRLTEHCTVELVTDSSVGALPHLLELEFLNASLIGGNCSALNAYLVLLNCVGGLKGNLVVGGITVLDAQIEILDVDV